LESLPRLAGEPWPTSVALSDITTSGTCSRRPPSRRVSSPPRLSWRSVRPRQASPGITRWRTRGRGKSAGVACEKGGIRLDGWEVPQDLHLRVPSQAGNPI